MSDERDWTGHDAYRLEPSHLNGAQFDTYSTEAPGTWIAVTDDITVLFQGGISSQKAWDFALVVHKALVGALGYYERMTTILDAVADAFMERGDALQGINTIADPAEEQRRLDSEK